MYICIYVYIYTYIVNKASRSRPAHIYIRVGIYVCVYTYSKWWSRSRRLIPNNYYHRHTWPRAHTSINMCIQKHVRTHTDTHAHRKTVDKVHHVCASKGRLFTASSDNSVGVVSIMEGREEEGQAIRLTGHEDRVGTLCRGA